MANDALLARLVALGITRPGVSRRQAAIDLAKNLAELGDDTLPVTLQRKCQSWLNGEDGTPALLGVVLTLLEQAHAQPRSRKTAA
jgi:hypothetical protein